MARIQRMTVRKSVAVLAPAGTFLPKTRFTTLQPAKAGAEFPPTTSGTSRSSGGYDHRGFPPYHPGRVESA